MKLSPQDQLLVYIVETLNESIKERDLTASNDSWNFARGKVAASAKILDKARELGLENVESAVYLASQTTPL